MRMYVPIAIVTAILLIPAGFALSYSGSADTDGEVSATCISLGAYTQDGGSYILTQNIFTDKVPVTKTGSTYSANPSGYVISNGVYLRTFGADSFDLSWNGTVSGDFTSPSLTVLIDSVSVPQGSDISVSDGYHSISVSFTGSYSGSTMPALNVDLEFAARTTCSGVFTESADSVRLKATSPATVQEIMVENNEDLVTTGGYTISTTTSTNHGNNYPSVGLQNDSNPRDGIADNDGQIDVSITVPQGYMFVIYLRTTTNTSNTFDILMKNGDEIVLSGTVTFNSGIGTTGRYLSEKSYDGSSTGYFYTSLTQVDNYSAWMSGDVNDYTIEITTSDGESASRNLMMDLVFKRET